MMKVLVVIAHPHQDSFNYAILDRLKLGLQRAGHSVDVQDLYASGFDPVLRGEELAALQQGHLSADVDSEQSRIKAAEGLIFIYPLWWFDRPAMLKGWCDRVLTQGFAFQYDDLGVTGLLPCRKAMVIVTSGGSEAELIDLGAGKEQLLLPMTAGTLGYCGIPEVEGHVYFSVSMASAPLRAEMLGEVEALGAGF
ncbi:MAG TPA: flavodoxin family protein [Gammaproteobacteria bacterium]|nr:flavodoxin family protein [Gammaproteobacteria bacterium]